MTHLQKMAAGDWYNPGDAETTALRDHSHATCRHLNAETGPGRMTILAGLFGSAGAGHQTIDQEVSHFE